MYLRNSGSASYFLTLVFAAIFLASLGVSHNVFADQVVATIPVGSRPWGIAINPVTNMVYVGNMGATSVHVKTLSVIDGSTDAVVSTIHGTYPPYGVGVNPVTNKIYVAGLDGSYVTVINGSTNAVVNNIPDDGGPDGIGVNPNTNKIYVVNFNGTVSIIDGSTDNVTATIQVGTWAREAGVNPVTNKIYVTSDQSNDVYVIDGSTNAVVRTIQNLNGAYGIAVNPVTDKIYVSYNDGIVVIDGATDDIIATMNVNGIYGAGINPSTNKIYAAYSDHVSVVNSSTNTVMGTVPVGSSPTNISVNPDTDRIYVTNYWSNTVSVIDGSTTNFPPSAPQNLQSSAKDSQVTLSWFMPSSNGGSAITNYNIYRGTTPYVSETLLTQIGNVTSYDDTAVTNGRTYYYKVTAVNSMGESGPSNDAYATPTAPSGSGSTSGIALNNVQSTSDTTDSSNQIILSNFNATVGNDRLLVVGVSANSNNVGSITFAGVPLTRAVSHFTNNDAEFWYLANPSGTGDIMVTMNGPTQAVVGAYSFSGVNQTVPIPTHITRHNLSPSSPAISITTQYPNDLVLDLPSIYGGSTLGSPTCTQQWDLNVSNAVTGASSSTMVPSPATVTCSWTASSDDMWDDAAIELRALG